MKTKLVIFTTNNARILIGANPKNYPTAIVNPDLSKVGKFPPHFWKLNNKGEILPMSTLEQKLRLEHHAKHGVDNDISKAFVKKWKLKIDRSVWAALAGAGSGFLAAWFAA